MKEFYKVAIMIALIMNGLVGCKSKDVFSYLDNGTQPEKKILPIQKKYGAKLGVPPESIANIPLYKFIDSWMGTPYKLGGETKKGIDCSFFTQFLYHDVYNNLIERTAEKQYMAPSTDKFIGQEFLREGDLLFFNKTGSQREPISHVGIYLGNNHFVHSTARASSEGFNGVQISNFKEAYWQKIFVAAGRKPKTGGAASRK